MIDLESHNGSLKNSVHFDTDGRFMYYTHNVPQGNMFTKVVYVARVGYFVGLPLYYVRFVDMNWVFSIGSTDAIQF